MKLHLCTPGGPEVNYYQVQVKLQPGVYFYYIGKVSHISVESDDKPIAYYGPASDVVVTFL